MKNVTEIFCCLRGYSIELTAKISNQRLFEFSSKAYLFKKCDKLLGNTETSVVTVMSISQMVFFLTDGS